ncbi:MAG: hypothetical protein PHQ98_02485, partial [Candidatus ainarchaeum sp.]|nr:hypothetical protein [Candidatus ainarchaeum sp.]
DEQIIKQQGLAAIGQVELMREYISRFDLFGIICAQILISQNDLNNKLGLENIKHTINFLFENNVVPIINENDVVAIDELRKDGVFSDNDILSALIAEKLNANLLVFLTTKNGIIGKDGEIISDLSDANQICKMGQTSTGGRGGIFTKLSALSIANKSGCDVFVSGPDLFFGFSENKAKGTFSKKY